VSGATFDYFLALKVVKKQSPDVSRAEFLKNEADRGYKNLTIMIKKIEISDENANDYIKMCYDIIAGAIRAKMLINGYSSSGFRAHEAEVSYLREIGFSENDVQFADQLRYFRNGTLYYGTALDKEYAEKVLEFLHRIYQSLKKKINLEMI